MFGKNFQVNSSIGKFRDLLGHFDQKDAVDFSQYHFLLNDSLMS